ncbi:coiled-coil domain-containing protein 80 isoform X2 [Eucyclogobius newberryi]|uniref:coiled-coil domain-containing protein 80 isoform X2 n=1 Tax=Eucyclogobius newberryi TaxID=166745 RepID=UPI003B5B1167
MLPLYKLVLISSIWSCVHAWPGVGQSKSKYSDPNVRDWGDYSDLPTGLELGLGLEEDQQPEKTKAEPTTTLAPELDFLGDFAGKKRLWIITASSHNDNYLRMMEKQLEDMEQAGLNCHLAERDTYIITIIQNAMMEGRIVKTTMEGQASVETLDPDTVSKLLHYLELTGYDEFIMLVIKKNLRTSERFPYPVRVKAIFEIIDQFPKRKLEVMTRKGPNMRCKIKKKVVMKRKKMKTKMVLSSQRRGNVTSVIAPQRKAVLDRKEALKSKIQDILSGRSRFVIRKGSSRGSTPEQNREEKGSQTQKETDSLPSVTSSSHEKRTYEAVTKTQKEDQNANGDGNEKPSPKKKGKGKKGKKKGRGRKSSREVSDKDRAALRDFVDSLKGTRRLMLISTASQDAKLYVQLKEENEKQHCGLAIRKITMAAIEGQGSDATLTLEHYRPESNAPASGPSEQISDAGLISLLRSELGLSSSDLFSMTITDYDIKPTRVFEAPPSTPALFEFIDNFSSRLPEKEMERKTVPACFRNYQQPEAENSLLRFMSKRRLLLISAPSEEDYSFQQQLSALSGQHCALGIRHFAMLKLTGARDRATGTVELFPLNGRSQSEVEPLSKDTVNNLREQLKISKDYFSMLVVGKDGDVKAWFTSPMWSLDSVYDLVDSMELRAQEERLQRRLGIQCSDDKDQRGGEEGHYGYDVEGTDERYLYQGPEE